MAEEQQSPGPVPVLMIIILLATVGSAALIGRSLISARPSQKICETEARKFTEQADARLWQDPLAAVQDHLTKFLTKPDVLTPIPADLYLESSPAESAAARLGDFLTIGVLLDGGRYEENSETRLRTRYAVLSTLADKGFTPADPTHIRFSKIAFTSPPDTLIVPFELLMFSPGVGMDSAKASVYSAVLVLWINETHIENELTERLNELLAPGPECGVSVIGPFASDGLVKLRTLDSKFPLTVYSPWATMPDALLSEATPAGPTRNIKVIRVLKDDFQLMKLLVPELKNRHVKFESTQHGTSVALITEWDTAYGRAISTEFEAAVQADTHPIPGQALKDMSRSQDYYTLLNAYEDSPLLPTARLFHYFRGIDGALPKEESSVETSPKSKSEDRSKEPERPEGQSQLDYIRSLARQLGKQKDPQVQAVGVFGTDVYDKLLIIQALREYVPRALILTTDLDSRLWHSSQLKWTRNVIVASASSLDPNSSWGFGDFRYSYQNAIYRAVSASLGEKVSVPPPAIYEIGKTGPELLQDHYSNPFIVGGILKWPHISPDTFFFLGVLPLLLLMIAVFAVSGDVWGSGHVKLALLVFLGGVLLLLGGTSLIFMPKNSVMEPFPPPVVGISTWPTEIIRSFNYLLALIFIISSLTSISSTNSRISQRFGLEALAKTERRKPLSWALTLLMTFAPSVNGIRLPNSHESSKTNANAEWNKYRLRMSANHLSLRLIVLTLAYFMAFFGVFMLFRGANAPARGPASFHFDYFVIFLNVISLLVLVSLTLYSAVSCRALVAALGKNPTNWPVDTLPKFEDKWIPREILSEWLDLQLIYQVTRPVDRLVIYPFLIMTILIFSRIPFFDRWSWPLPLIIVFSLELTTIVVSLFMVRRAALEAKERVIREIDTQLRLATAEGTKTASDRAATIRLVRDEIVNYRKGTFGPLSHHPVMIALLMPFGGLGTVVVLNLLSRL